MISSIFLPLKDSIQRVNGHSLYIEKKLFQEALNGIDDHRDFILFGQTFSCCFEKAVEPSVVVLRDQ